MNVSLDVSDQLVEQIARRAAELVAESATGGNVEDSSTFTGYLDVAGAAEFLACKPSRIYALVSARRIPFSKDGSRLLFDRGELRAYVAAGGAVRP